MTSRKARERQIVKEIGARLGSGVAELADSINKAFIEPWKERVVREAIDAEHARRRGRENSANARRAKKDERKRAIAKRRQNNPTLSLEAAARAELAEEAESGYLVMTDEEQERAVRNLLRSLRQKKNTRRKKNSGRS